MQRGGDREGMAMAMMASTFPLKRNLLEAILAFGAGDFSARLPIKWNGVRGKIADAFNEAVAMSELRARQAAHVARLVGKEGRLQQRMATSGFAGAWADEIEALNRLLDDLAPYSGGCANNRRSGQGRPGADYGA
jgi:hypothetical protein